MSRSPVISTLLIYALFIVSTVLSAPREDIISGRSTDREFHKTREAEFLEQPSRRLRNERFDVSRKDESLHRPARVMKETPSRTNNSEEEKLGMEKSSVADNKSDNLRLNAENSEIRDMIESHVSPKDDDDDETPNVREKSSSMPGKGTTSKAKNLKNNASVSTILPPEIFPNDNTIADIRIASPQWLEELEKTSYTTDETQKNKATTDKRETVTESVMLFTLVSKHDKVQSPNVESTTSATAAPTASAAPTTTTAPITTAAPAKTIAPMTAATTTTNEPPSVTSNPTNTGKVSDNPTTTTDRPTSSSPSPAEAKLHEKKKPVPASMPSGVVALITAISFTIVGIVAYIGFIVRKRYLEWRYGNRELLVNDFDAADISNFEL